MSIFLQRKIRAKWIGNNDYKPKNFEITNFVPVIGFECRRVMKNINGEEKSVEELFLIIIDDNGKAISTASFNWRIMIDSSDENVDKTLQMLQNATVLVKSLAGIVSKDETPTKDKG